MGLASKLAASQQGAGGYSGQPPPAQYNPAGGPPPAGGAPGGYPGQQSYSPYPGAGGQQRPPGGQPGGYPPYGGQPGGGGYPGQPGYQQQQQQQQQYGGGGYGQQAPPQQRPVQGAPPEAYKQLLQQVVQQKGLQNFRWPAPTFLDDLSKAAGTRCPDFCRRWNVPAEIGNDVVKLGLFDVIFFVDNSGSMRFEENGERIRDLKLILERAAYATSLFDTDGISVRFMNWSNARVPAEKLDGIRSEEQANALITPDFPFQGLTPLGTELKKQVLVPMVWNKIRNQTLAKPVLIIIITDGQPAGESRDTLANAIAETKAIAQSMPQFGQRPVSFQIAQVGNDQAARDYLKELDDNVNFGDIVDCTSNFENEQVEYANAKPPVDLTPDLWLMKLLLGAIDDSYDKQDEQTSAPPAGYGAPPGGYGGGPPPQQGGYNRPPPSGPPGGYPPQGYPPQGRPPQGGPPQGGGYPPQGGYGGPPQGYPPQGGYQPQGGGYPGQPGYGRR